MIFKYNNHTQDAHNYDIQTSSLSWIVTFSEKSPSCVFNITNKTTATSKLLVDLSCSKKYQDISYLKNVINAIESIILLRESKLKLL